LIAAPRHSPLYPYTTLFRSELAEAFDRRHLAEQVDGHNRLRARRHRGLGRAGIDVERLRLDVHEHRFGADVVDRAGGREERERRDRKGTRLNSSHEWISYAV